MQCAWPQQRVMPSPINSDPLQSNQRFMYQVGQQAWWPHHPRPHPHQHHPRPHHHHLPPSQSSWMTLGSARDVIRLTRWSGCSVIDRELSGKPPAVIRNGIPEHSKDGTQAQPPPMLAGWIVQRWPPFEISIPPNFF